MSFLAWRGYGLIGAVPPVLGLIALGTLTDLRERAAFLGVGLAVAAAGVAVAIAGRRMGPNPGYHTLYYVPLWVWGIGYALLGLVLAGHIGMLVAAAGVGPAVLTAETVGGLPRPAYEGSAVRRRGSQGTTARR